MAVDRSPVTYGNWSRPQTAGLAGQGQLGSAVIFGGMLGLVFIMLIGGDNALPWAIGWSVMLGIVLLLMKTKDRHHRTPIHRVAERIGHLRAQGTGANLYRSGPIGRTKWGTFQLPGVIAETVLSSHTDSYGREFALIRMPSAHTYSVVFASEPGGVTLQDSDMVDLQVAKYGQWLSQLGDEPGLECASVTIETAPESGQRLSDEVGEHLDPDAPAFARQMLQESVAVLPSGASSIRAYVALTFNAAPRKGDKKRATDEMSREIAVRLAGLTQGLQGTGSGVMHPMTAEDLCEVVRVAYDPLSQSVIDQAHAAGVSPDLTWSDVGPAAHQAEWSGYWHDSGYSMVYGMSEAPRGIVQSSILSRFLAPHADIARKRVTFLYKAVEPGVAADLVEKDVNAASFRASSARRASARMGASQSAVQATAREEASGAGLINFGMLATATVDDPRKAKFAAAAMDSLSPTARLRLRPVYGSQDSAFAACLPLGLALNKYLAAPSQLRNLN